MTASGNDKWRRSALAGLAYAAVVFATGFMLGIVRIVALAPRLGETAAVFVELPVILTISWLVSARLASRFAVPSSSGHRLCMGSFAFMLLMEAEAVLSTFAFGRSLAEHAALYRLPAHQIGLAGQIIFALIPWLQRHR